MPGSTIGKCTSTSTNNIMLTHNHSAKPTTPQNNQTQQDNPANPPQQEITPQIKLENVTQQSQDVFQQPQNQDDLEYNLNSRYAFVGEISQEAYEYAMSGLKVATYGIGFSAGIGFNIPACILALCVGGTAGVVCGIISGTYNIVTDNRYNSSATILTHPENHSTPVNNKARGWFGLFSAAENDQVKITSTPQINTNAYP